MALQGDLQDFTVTQLLNLVNLANKSGALLIQGPNEGARLIFRQGRLAYAQLANEAAAAQGSHSRPCSTAVNSSLVGPGRPALFWP